MQWVTFEPNNALLWKEIDRAVRSFLDRCTRPACSMGQVPKMRTRYGVMRPPIRPLTPTLAASPAWWDFSRRSRPSFVVVRVGVTRSGIQVEERGPGCLRRPSASIRYRPSAFTVAFDDLPPGGFSDCTGLQSEVEVQEYAEGGLNTHTWKLPAAPSSATW